MDSIIEYLKNMSENDAKQYIFMLFSGYEIMKKENKLYEGSIIIPQIIILTYYTCIRNPIFNNIYEQFKDKYLSKNFKERYLYNENKLEHVHTKEEQHGLRLVYDYIQKMDDFEQVNLYTITQIHRILFSETPFPEFGGRYRTEERYLPNTGIDLLSPSLITHEMNLLRSEIDEIVKEGLRLGNEIDPQKLITYINKCIELKCKLIKIHPFGDGNGRSIRAFINLLFRLANIPPIYIENKERQKYNEAMNEALGEGKDSKIKQFYYYKICDSIISLDINYNKSFEEDKTKKIKYRIVNI